MDALPDENRRRDRMLSIMAAAVVLPVLLILAASASGYKVWPLREAPVQDRQTVSPYTQYLQQIGLLTPGASTSREAYDRSLYRNPDGSEGPIPRLFQLRQRFDPALGNPREEIGPFIEANANRFRDDPDSIYSDAGDILRGLLNLGAAEREARGVTFSPFHPAATRGASVRQVSLQAQRELFALALRPLFGVRGANRLSNRLPEEQSIWERQTFNDPSTPAFLEWFIDKYNLGDAFE